MTVERQFFHKHKLPEPCKHLYEYYVTGKGEFPFDMLRYDCAWPATSNDAVAMLNDNTLRSVKMYSHRPPTRERWLSFVWSVGTERI